MNLYVYILYVLLLCVVEAAGGEEKEGQGRAEKALGERPACHKTNPKCLPSSQRRLY